MTWGCFDVGAPSLALRLCRVYYPSVRSKEYTVRDEQRIREWILDPPRQCVCDVAAAVALAE